METISMSSFTSNNEEGNKNNEEGNKNTEDNNNDNNNNQNNNNNNNQNNNQNNNANHANHGNDISILNEKFDEEENGGDDDDDEKNSNYKSDTDLFDHDQQANGGTHQVGSKTETDKQSEKVKERTDTQVEKKQNPRMDVMSMDKFSDVEKSEKNNRATMAGDKIIDFILSYNKPDGRDEKDEDEQGNIKMRQSFEENLQDFGIEIEREEETKDCFVKLHCPWDTLCRGAQLIKLKKPVSTKNIQPQTKDKWIGCIKRNEVKIQVHQPFSIKEIGSFVIEDEKTFFSSSERNYITLSILERTVFQSQDRIQTGLENLLGEGAYKAAYPLHDPLPSPPNHDESKMNEREFLLYKWANKKNLVRNQPLLVIRSYFGEMFAFYFAWMGMYIGFLSIASVFGVAVTVYGLVSLYTSPMMINDICDATKAPGNFTLCPKCDQLCNYTQLSHLCTYAKFTQVFDNGGTLFFSVFICIWAICFCEMWKRRQVFLQYLWSVNDFESNENVRPEYEKQATMKKKNPISGLDESYVPSMSLLVRRCLSVSMVLFLLMVVLITIIAVLMYRFFIAHTLHQSKLKMIKGNAQIITTVTAATLNLIFITILSFIYKWLAKVLTDIEAHKTRSSYQDSFIFKIVVFQFINYYGAIIYIAFFKGSFVDSPGYHSMYVLGKYKQDECESIGCMSELTIQLIIIMIGKQVLNAVLEMLIPFIKRAIKMRDNKVAVKYLPWERDLDLGKLEVVPIYSEYLEMVIQYGFVVLFGAAFPLAPLFALINNMFEIRLDAYKLLRFVRRPPGWKAQDIGAWQNTIETFSRIAVITNAFIIAWTSDFIPKMVYSHVNGGKMDGYLKYTFVSFDTSNFTSIQSPDIENFPGSVNVTECKYRSYSIPSEQVTLYYESFYWQVLCARWAFVIIFQHACFLFISLLRTIPDQSDNVKLIREYEKTIHNQVQVNDLFERVREKKSSMNIISPFLKPTNFATSMQNTNVFY